MEIKGKAIALNILTLGYTGAKATHDTIKRIKEKRSIPTLPEVALFIYLVPMIYWLSFFLDIAILLGVDLPQDIRGDFGVSAFDTLVGAFITFSFIHLILGVALLQNLKEQKNGHRAAIIWFGCYALDWDPLESFKDEK
ncbi:MAG: hypothetical protein ACSHX8_00300 [Opitutaceae bacterium]